MEPLLQITSIPITYELKVNNAQLDYVNGKADVEIKNFHNGGFKIKSQPTKLNIDTFECFNSMCPTNTRSIKMAAERGKATAYEATATYAQEGKLLLNAKLGEDVLGQIAASKSQVSTDIGITFKPSVPPEISWSKPELTMEYEVDKL